MAPLGLYNISIFNRGLNIIYDSNNQYYCLYYFLILLVKNKIELNPAGAYVASLGLDHQLIVVYANVSIANVSKLR